MSIIDSIIPYSTSSRRKKIADKCVHHIHIFYSSPLACYVIKGIIRWWIKTRESAEPFMIPHLLCVRLTVIFYDAPAPLFLSYSPPSLRANRIINHYERNITFWFIQHIHTHSVATHLLLTSFLLVSIIFICDV